LPNQRRYTAVPSLTPWDTLQVQTVRGDATVAIERAEARASEERRRAAAREAELAQRCEELAQRVEQLQVGAW
jgi:hypothetical protein